LFKSLQRMRQQRIVAQARHAGREEKGGERPLVVT
jgi:hypothetical protein